MSFDGRSAIVTGAAGGIGREIARQMAAGGARVLVTDLPGVGAEAVAEEIGSGAEAMSVDVSRREEVQAAIDRVVAERGRLDYIFNNAGVAIFGEAEIVSLDDWDKIIDVNLRGVAYGTTLAYRQMVRQGGGHVVNTASVAGLVPVPLQMHYCATKHAVIGLSKALAVEAREHGVRVTAFCPGFVRTGMFVNSKLLGTLEGADAGRLVPIRPLTAERAAERLLVGVERGREIVVTPFYGRVGWWAERLSPTLAAGFHRRALHEIRRRAKADRE